MFKSFVNLIFIRQTKFLYLSFFLFATAVGINLVTFPSVLKLHKISPSQIGIAFGVEVCGVAIMSFFLSKFVKKFGIINSLRIASILYASIVLIIYFYSSFWWWLLLVFVLGCCWLIFAICRLSWLNLLLSDEERRLRIGIISALISAGLAFGPMIVKLFGAENYLSFATSAFVVLGCSLCLNPLKQELKPQINSARISMIKFFKKNPNSFFSRFFLDFTSYSMLSLAVVFGTGIGFTNENSGLLITAYMVSGFFDIFVGFMLKKTPAKTLINIGYLGCLYTFLLVSLYQKSFYFLIILFFIFGLFIACIYVSVFKMINEDYEEKDLIPANSTFQFVGTCGALAGSLICGFMINFFGAQGFPITICFGCLFYLTFLVIYEKNKK